MYVLVSSPWAASLRSRRRVCIVGFQSLGSTTDSWHVPFQTLSGIKCLHLSDVFHVTQPSFAVHNLKEFTRSSAQIQTWPLDAAKDGDRKIGRRQEMNGWIDGESEGRWRQREERREGEVLMNGLMAHWPTNVTAALPVAPSGLLKHTYRDLCVNYYKTQVGINSNTPMAFLHMHTGPLLLLLLLLKVQKKKNHSASPDRKHVVSQLQADFRNVWDVFLVCLV